MRAGNQSSKPRYAMGCWLEREDAMNVGVETPSAAEDDLADLIGEIAQTDGDHATPVPERMLYRRSAASEPMPCVYGMGLGMTVRTVAAPDAGLLRALIQLLRLLRESALVPLVGPPVRQEIVARLLTGEHGPTLRPSSWPARRASRSPG